MALSGNVPLIVTFSVVFPALQSVTVDSTLSVRIWHAGETGNVLIDEDADRVNSYDILNYAEGHNSYYRSMLVDLTKRPGEVSDFVF